MSFCNSVTQPVPTMCCQLPQQYIACSFFAIFEVICVFLLLFKSGKTGFHIIVDAVDPRYFGYFSVLQLYFFAIRSSLIRRTQSIGFHLKWNACELNAVKYLLASINSLNTQDAQTSYKVSAVMLKALLNYNQPTLICRPLTVVKVVTLTLLVNKKASIRWQDSARRQFQAGLIGDVGL